MISSAAATCMDINFSVDTSSKDFQENHVVDHGKILKEVGGRAFEQLLKWSCDVQKIWLMQWILDIIWCTMNQAYRNDINQS